MIRNEFFKGGRIITKLSEFKDEAIYWLSEGQSWGSVCAADDEEVKQLIKIISNIGKNLKLKGVEPDTQGKEH